MAADDGASMIRFVDVHKRFGAHNVLRGVDFSIARGAVHFVMGRSGVGKSVLIKSVVGLLQPDDGEIFFGGVSLRGLDEAAFMAIRQRCQLIFQHATLFEAMTVLENMMMPICKRFRVSKSVAKERAMNALARLHLTPWALAYPPALGMGVQKRIAIARALVLQPEVLLYDEPTTGLDPVAARRTDRLIQEVAAHSACTSVVVSHDVISASMIADVITFLHAGRVYFHGSSADFFASTDPILRAFLHGPVDQSA